MQSDKKAVTKVWIEPGCITCGACQDSAPDIFEVHDISYIKPAIKCAQYSDDIKVAASLCPVNVIHYEEK